MMWISLIQYIGANVGKSSHSYVPHSLTLLDRISEVSPEFASAYEWALWLMPIPQNTSLIYSEEQKSALAYPLSIAHRGI